MRDFAYKLEDVADRSGRLAPEVHALLAEGPLYCGPRRHPLRVGGPMGIVLVHVELDALAPVIEHQQIGVNHSVGVAHGPVAALELPSIMALISCTFSRPLAFTAGK